MKQDLFSQLGLQKLSDQEKVQLSADLGEVALDRISARLDGLLTPEQGAEVAAKMQTGEAAGFALLKEYVPDYQKIAREEIDRLRAEMVDTHAAIMDKLDLDDEA